MKKKAANHIVVDIGSHKIAALAAYIAKDGQAAVNSQILQYSQGFKSGQITNMELAENSLTAAIYALEKEVGKTIREISLSLSGQNIRSYYVKHQIKLGNQAVSKQDVRKLINKALAEFKIADYEIIQYFPLEFVINNQTVENPINMYGKELSCQLHILAANSLMMLNLAKCLDRCHITINEVFPAIYTASLACLNEDEKQLGSIIIDLGSKTTSFALFLHNQIIYTDYLTIGSDDITHDIAKKFSVSLKIAEKLKILYGNANSKMVKNMTLRLGELEANPENELGELTIEIIDIAKLIENRIIDLLTKIKAKCDKIEMSQLLAEKLVITGGGACLAGIVSQASNIFEKQVRVAKPKLLAGFTENYNIHIYSSSLGIIMAKALKIQQNSSKYALNENVGILGRTLTWLRENI